MEAKERDELQTLQSLTAVLAQARAALQAGTPSEPSSLAQQQELLTHLLALRATAGQGEASPALQAAVLDLQEIVAAFEHALRVGMAEIRARLKPQTQSSTESFADRIGRGHSLGSA
ncbi:hypothetical protein AB4090_03295 [Acidithiobacillus sp. IBUN Pt1247-S3]|uniref:hypothetical protein n=1 Tax=Acidithiobacillus sp. IBUN Pt1247-S3 TaxID=3166642 RepID=UPI0034E55EF5